MSKLGPEAPVPILQWEEEFEEVLTRYRRRAPRMVLEVGTYHGGTLYHWLRNASTGACVVSLDSYRTGVDNRHLYAEWCPSGVQLVTLEGDSHDMAVWEEALSYGPYDWVFIDAGHYYHEVHRDWELYGATALFSRDSVVVLHDILPPTPEHPEIEVARLWAELVASPLYHTEEIVADRSASWGGLGLVVRQC